MSLPIKSSQRLVARALSVLLALGLFLPGTASAQGVGMGGGPGAEVPEPPPLQIGPVSGLTTGWHPAPDDAVVPYGALVSFRQSVPIGADVTWFGAEQILRDATGSTAVCPLPAAGDSRVRVLVEFPAQPGLLLPASSYEHTCSLSVSYRDPTGFGVDHVDASVAPPLTAHSNEALVEMFFDGESIADLTQLRDEVYLTSVRRTIDMIAEADMGPYGALLEWRVDGEPVGLGLGRAQAFGEPGLHVVSAGPPAHAAALHVQTYRTEVFGIEPGDLQSESVQAVAVTDPPGYEHHVRWMASTKFGWASPLQGQGPVFATEFHDTVGSIQWVGVCANEYAQGEDPDPACAWNNATVSSAGGNTTVTVSVLNDEIDIIRIWHTPPAGVQVHAGSSPYDEDCTPGNDQYSKTFALTLGPFGGDRITIEVVCCDGTTLSKRCFDYFDVTNTWVAGANCQ